MHLIMVNALTFLLPNLSQAPPVSIPIRVQCIAPALKHRESQRIMGEVSH